jgi:aldehyde dehydrogenase (NAD+)
MSAPDIKDSHTTLTKTFATNITKSIKWRKWQLKQFWWMLEENSDRFVESLHSDLHRNSFETVGLEVKGTQADVIDALTNVDKWAAGEKPEAGFLFGTLGKAHLRKEPLGVCLVIGAWNYPIATLLMPVVAAIAAGNVVVIKPSELAPATQDLLVEIVPRYLDQSAIRVATGGAEETGKMLELKWDHLFYTGGSKVGRIIAAAGAKNLSRVTLELGGQCPVIVDKTANIDLAAKRVAAAKITNLGQICLNANHVYADPIIHDQFVERLIHWNKVFAKDNGEEQFAHIISERHFDRITNLLKSSSGEVVYGGETDRSKKWSVSWPIFLANTNGV